MVTILTNRVKDYPRSVYINRIPSNLIIWLIIERLQTKFQHNQIINKACIVVAALTNQRSFDLLNMAGCCHISKPQPRTWSYSHRRKVTNQISTKSDNEQRACRVATCNTIDQSGTIWPTEHAQILPQCELNHNIVKKFLLTKFRENQTIFI